MKKFACLILVMIIVAQSSYAMASFCEISPSGNHLFFYYKDSVHTASLHKYYRVCEECGLYEFISYQTKYDCCQCVGHSYTGWSAPAVTHTDAGHKITRSCVRCGVTQTNFVSDHTCCQCTNNHQYVTHTSPVHTVRGHLQFDECTKCHETVPRAYVKVSDCCQCGYHFFSAWSYPSSDHGPLGHLQQRSCSKCGYTESKYSYSYNCCLCTGNHNYQYSISSYHTANGHAVYGQCSYCGDTILSGYTTISSCCCGIHQYGAWGEIQALHTGAVHLQKKVCTTCGAEEIRYVKKNTCCLCNGHTMGNWSYPGVHTESGHLISSQCLHCDYAEEKYVNDFNCSLCRTEPSDEAEFMSFLKSKGIPCYSSQSLYQANYATYQKYGLIVYGSQSQVTGNEYKEGEYRYLGYSYLNELFTNMYFPNDSTSTIKPELWDYILVNGAIESYDLLEQTVQRPYMLNTLLTGHGATTLKAADIGITKAKVQTGATWADYGSIYTKKSNGYYATFMVTPMGYGTLQGKLIPSVSHLVFKSTDTFLEMTLTFEASVNKPDNEINFMKSGIGNDPKVTVSKKNSMTVTKTMMIEKPATDYIEMIYTATVEVESLFGDKLEKEVYLLVKVYVSDEIIIPDPPEVPEIPEIPEVVIPFSVTISGAYHHWKESHDIFGSPLVYHEHRFLSLEKLFVNIKAEKGIDQIIIRFSPELEAMSYLNSYGHYYDYFNDFNLPYVYFPSDSTFYFNNEDALDFTFSYILPMCPETIDFNNVRKKDPYYLSICYISGETVCYYLIEDIDITGTVYDLIYPQPGR